MARVVDSNGVGVMRDRKSGRDVEQEVRCKIEVQRMSVNEVPDCNFFVAQDVCLAKVLRNKSSQVKPREKKKSLPLLPPMSM